MRPLYVIVVLLIIYGSMLVSADIISVNSGGSENLAITPDKFTEGFFFPPVCGNNVVEGSEQCDDGNTASGDGCSSTCQTESSTTSTSSTSSGGGGGGGAGGGAAAIAKEIEDLNAIPDSINLPAASKINTSTKLSLRNEGNKTLQIKISLSDLNENIIPEASEVTINPGETITLNIKIIPPVEPKTYTAKIILISGNFRTEIPIALNVDSELSLFDITLEIPDEYRAINIGEKILTQIILIQAGLQENRDVQMEYEIKDFEGNIYSKETETIAVFKEKTFQKEFDTNSLEPGEYLATAAVIYSGGVATASSQFTVEETEIVESFGYISISILIIAILILVVSIIIAKNYKRKK